jgi:hypothetical protein
MTRHVESDLEVWIARLPGYQLRSTPSEGRDITDSPSPVGVTDSLASDVAVFDHLRPDSFVRDDQFPAVLRRDITAVSAHTHGQVIARVLRANPAREWPQPPWRRRTTGPRISLLLNGTVWFDLADFGEQAFSAHDSWSLPSGLDHALLEASCDFVLVEIELPVAASASHAVDTTIPEMLMLYATYSYRAIPSFGKPATHRANASTGTADPSGTLSLKLDNKAPDAWAGCPWHLHERGIQFGYVTRGTARMEIEGIGVVDALPGTFWLQQARNELAPSPLPHDDTSKHITTVDTTDAAGLRRLPPK